MKLSELRSRLDTLQRQRWCRIVATVLLLALAGGFFGRIVSIRVNWDKDSAVLATALTGDEATTYGILLRNEGRIVIDGEVFEAPTDVMQTYLEEDGTTGEPQRVIFILLQDSIPDWAPKWLLLDTSLSWKLMVITSVIGIAIIWTGLLVSVVTLIFLGAVFSGIFAVFDGGQWIGVPVAICTLLSAYLLAVRILQLLLSSSMGWSAVAHTLLWEASRTRLSLAFVVTLLITMPLLPLTLTLDAPIDQVVQAYIARSLGLAFLLSAFMMLMLGCSSVCFDIRDRHIWHLVSKPLGRFNYLFGKWLGVILLGGVMLAVAGSWSFGYVQYLRVSYLPRTTAEYLAQQDLLEDVLVARTSKRPIYLEMSGKEVRARIDELVLEDPAYQEYVDNDLPLATFRVLRKRVFDDFDIDQRRIDTLFDQTGKPWKKLHFEGLQEARELGLPMRLSFKIYGGSSDEHDRRLIGIATGEDLGEGVLGPFIPTMPQHVDIAPSAIAEDGTLDVTLVNLTQHTPPAGNDWRGPAELEPLAMTMGDRAPFAIFWLADELELGYPQGTFGSNFFWGMVVLWLKLAVLAAFACAVATTLSFPVACLVVFAAYAAASIAPWIGMSLMLYGSGGPSPESAGEYIQWFLQATVRTVASSVVYLLRGFGELQPIGQLIEGKLITWAWIREGLFMAVVWGGGAILFGWFVLLRRQLAIYSGEE
jgi:hypothetical protein